MKMDKEILVGRQLLDVVTSGMYNSPLMIYREYIQNAVDSIDQMENNSGDKRREPHIQINIDGLTRAIVVEDNGAGILQETAVKTLLSLGLSTKERGSSRGFRGIGRLGGLAYCDRLIFETRALGEDVVTEVKWDRLKLDELAQKNIQVSLEEAIHNIVSANSRSANQEDPDSFFRVKLEKSCQG
ncbi:MAG: ATP-binding protein, partial [Deltaproteobacteria bacterium]